VTNLSDMKLLTCLTPGTSMLTTSWHLFDMFDSIFRPVSSSTSVYKHKIS